MSVTSSGSVAVAWPYALITSQDDGKEIAQTTQWRMRWLSPAGKLNAIIPLQAFQGGELCKPEAPDCGAGPGAPGLAAVGADQVMALFGAPRLVSEGIDGAGDVSAPTMVYSHLAFSDNEGDVASGGDKVVVTWQEGNTLRGSWQIWAAEWRTGHWSRPTLLAQRTSRSFQNGTPDYPSAYVNERGHACVIWPVIPNKPGGTSLGTHASFDFLRLRLLRTTTVNCRYQRSPANDSATQAGFGRSHTVADSISSTGSLVASTKIFRARSVKVSRSGSSVTRLTVPTAMSGSPCSPGK